MSNLAYRVAFTRIPGIGRARLQALETFLGDLEATWNAGAAGLTQAGLDKKTVQTTVALRPRISPEGEMERLERLNVAAITPDDPDFPLLLREIYDVPLVLYVRGQLLPQDHLAVAVVGTRKATVYGRQVAEEVVAVLARHGGDRH